MKLKKLLYAISPEWLFVTFAATFGLLTMLLTPPFQVPDEFHHFYRAYQVSEGEFKGLQKDHRLGGYIPTSLVQASNTFKPVRYGQRADKKIFSDFLSAPLNKDSLVFEDFPNTAIYSPVSYLSQATAIFLLGKLHFSIGYIFYGARFLTFLTWVVAIFYSIHIIPIFKRLFLLLALLPMSLYVNSSLSTDVVTNIGAFFTIAYILKCAFSDKKFTYVNLIVFALLTTLLSSTKILYTPLILLFFIIPKEKFKNKLSLYLQFSLLVILATVITISWATVIRHIHVSYSAYNPLYRNNDVDVYAGSDISNQILFILSHKLYFLRVVFNSFTNHRYIEGYIGTFGWFDTPLYTWLYILGYGTVFFVAVAESGYTNLPFTTTNKVTILVSFLGMAFLVMLSQYLSFSRVGDDCVIMQGRYFIPVFPLLFMSLNKGKFRQQQLLQPIITFFLCAILFATTLILFKRYF